MDKESDSETDRLTGRKVVNGHVNHEVHTE